MTVELLCSCRDSEGPPFGDHPPSPSTPHSAPHSAPVFLPTEEFQALLKRLPDDRFLNSTAISQFWAMDAGLQHRYQQLGASLKILFKKTHRIVRRLFNLCKRCHRQPRFRLPKERWAQAPEPAFHTSRQQLLKPGKALHPTGESSEWWLTQPFWFSWSSTTVMPFLIGSCVWSERGKTEKLIIAIQMLL